VPNRAYVTVVGVEDATTVWVLPSYDIEASQGAIPAGYQAVPELAAGVEHEFNLNRYEVLNLENKSRLTPFPDLTGTIVRSSAPVVVFFGTDLSSAADELVPGCDTLSDCSCCAEHLEQQVIPKVSMGWKYVVSHSAWRNTGGWIEPDYYRVLAVREGTHVTTSLPDVGSFDLGENEWYDFKARTGFVLDASQPVQVVQILTTQQQTEDFIGDASMIPFPAVEQRRPFYVFTTGEGFSENWAVVSMPEGVDALIDGADVASTCGSPHTDGTLDGLTYASYYCEIEDGPHVVDGVDEPVGVTVYGYYSAGSYGYPAGSDLREIFLE
jgi:hypothetical protein